jgi:transcriptional regulator with XRE-family HTH domain
MLHLGKTAKYVRESKRLTLRAAAAQLGISHVHLYNIEINKTAPSMQLLDKFREVFGVDLAVLAWCLHGDASRLPPAVRAPMEALAAAWREELGPIAEENQVAEAN